MPEDIDSNTVGRGNRAAFFDVDGTITSTTIAHYYVAFRLRNANPVYRAAWLAAYAPKGLQFFALDKIDRSRFVRKFYRQYEGVNMAEFMRWHKRYFREFTLSRIRRGALEAIKRHREAGDRVILVSGGVEERIAPLAQHLGADDFLATKLVQRDGHYTGEIEGAPLVDEEKAVRVRDYAGREGIDLSLSWAYGDSRSDTPFLELVGNPVAVGTELASIARERHWRIEEW
jgi:HAD superfamily hydrolase (TIGR01490 family)